jgi:MFS family permease
MEANKQQTTGMAGLTVIWIGQVASLIGTAMSQFGLTLWAYEVTGRATPLALVGFFFLVPMVVLGPFVGVMVDRSNRRLMMMLSDLAAAFTTVIVLVLYGTGNLQIWHLYVTATISGIFQGFQWPAYSVAITVMLPKEHYGRANGMLEMAGRGSAIFAPLLAGALIGPIGLVGILIIDLVTAAVAIIPLLFVHIPQPEVKKDDTKSPGGFRDEIVFGFRYIFTRPSLLGLQMVFMVANFFDHLGFSVLAPMILARTGSNELIFGSVQSAGAIGGVVGGLAMSIWGGPKRRVNGVLLGWFCAGLLGQSIMGLGRWLPVWAGAMFLRSFVGPILNGSNQAIWQSKVPPDVQGRVFATRGTIAWLVMPVGKLLAGPLADYVLEPGMAVGGPLTGAFGWLVGTGSGAGMSLQFVFAGLLAACVPIVAFLFSIVRDAEDILPDHDLSPARV